jgi:2-polyprenyl-6-methoxyphenol hydroxylase-like FAD-dependent oxidoreductase
MTRSLSVVVLGAGMAGLSVTLALARDGHRVTLVERDEVTVGEPAAATDRPRAGIPHFQQPHAFLPRGRHELRLMAPDVVAALLDAGAWDYDLRPKIQGPSRSGDEAFAYLSARRPLLEWALLRAVVAEDGVRILAPVRATGLDGTPGDVPRITGVLTTGGTIAADVVVDAMGRRSPASAWVQAMGGRVPGNRSTECGIIYYSRYYRVRDGATLPDGPWLPTPRGDLGYGGFSTFPGDNGTFAAVLAIPPGDQELKVLRHGAAYTAATATMPALHAWANPDVAEPITDVLPMGSLQNTIRDPIDGRPPAVGLIGVGDTVCHTDPALALGLSFGLIHAAELVMALRAHPDDIADAASAFDAATQPEMDERFGLASAIDDARSRRWAGEPVDLAHRDGGAYALFTLVAGSAAALVDGDVFRTVVRRNTFLDRLAVLDDDVATQQRIEAIFGELLARGAPRPGPARDELLAVTREAIDAASSAAV